MRCGVTGCLEPPDVDPLAGVRRRWRLVSDGAVEETHSSWVQPVRYDDVPAFLKAPKPNSDEVRTAAMLRYFGGRGAVRLVRADESAVLMERANGHRSLMDMATSGDDDGAAAALAGTVTKLHDQRGMSMPSGLPSLRDWFDDLFRMQNTSAILKRCATVAEHLLNTAHAPMALHGDLHHDNVLDGAERGWLAIDPKGVFGERTYEVANLLGNPWPNGAVVHDPDRMRRQARFYARELDLDVHRVLGFALAHAGLSAAWSIEDGCDPSFRLRCAEVLDPMVT